MDTYLHIHGRGKQKLAVIAREWDGLELHYDEPFQWFISIPDCDGRPERYEVSEAVYETVQYVLASRRWFLFLARHNHGAVQRGAQVL